MVVYQGAVADPDFRTNIESAHGLTTELLSASKSKPEAPVLSCEPCFLSCRRACVLSLASGWHNGISGGGVLSGLAPLPDSFLSLEGTGPGLWVPGLMTQLVKMTKDRSFRYR